MEHYGKILAKDVVSFLLLERYSNNLFFKHLLSSHLALTSCLNLKEKQFSACKFFIHAEVKEFLNLHSIRRALSYQILSSALYFTQNFKSNCFDCQTMLA